MKYLLLLSYFLFITFSFSQTNWSIDFGGTGEEFIRTSEIDQNGDLISIGSFEEAVDFDGIGILTSSTSGGLRDLFIMKTGPLGDILWVKTIGDTGYEDPYGLTIDNNNNILIAGRYFSTTDFDPGIGVSQITSNGTAESFLLKLDTNGDFLWVKSFGGTSLDLGKDVVVDVNDDIYLMGVFTSNGADYDPGIGVFPLSALSNGATSFVKLSNNGDFIWAKSFNSSMDIQANSLTYIENDGIYLAGYFSGDVNLDIGGITQTYTGNGTFDLFAMKVDTAGNPIWFTQFNGYGSLQNIFSLTHDSFGNIYGCGWFTDTLSYTISGQSVSVVPEASKNGFLFSISNLGNINWLNPLYSSMNSTLFSIDTDQIGNLYFTGNFLGTATYPGSATQITASNSSDVIIGVTDNNGNMSNLLGLDGNGQGAGYCIKASANGDVYISGVFDGSTMFNFGGINHSWISSGETDGFILSLGQSLNIEELDSENSISLYPNPTFDVVSIAGLDALQGTKNLDVFNCNGTHIMSVKSVTYKTRIELPKAGFYFMQITNENGIIVTKKIIKQ